MIILNINNALDTVGNEKFHGVNLWSNKKPEQALHEELLLRCLSQDNGRQFFRHVAGICCIMS